MTRNARTTVSCDELATELRNSHPTAKQERTAILFATTPYLLWDCSPAD